ncbi:Piwi-domain-containing protein [Hypomontagnella monticulosa]|nr:Piwi-domain-containing protein [Hypomontagnella monticulosa]
MSEQWKTVGPRKNKGGSGGGKHHDQVHWGSGSSADKSENQGPSSEPVAQAEDHILRDHGNKSTEVEIGKKGLTIPRRPGYCTNDAKTSRKLLANCVELEVNGKTLYRYNITVKRQDDETAEGTSVSKKPEAKGGKLARIIQIFIKQEKEMLGEVVTDFAGILISCNEIPGKQYTSEVIYRDEYATEPPENEAPENGTSRGKPRESAAKYTVSLKYNSALETASLLDYLRNPSNNKCTKRESIILALQIFLNHHPKNSESHATIGSSRSFPLGSSNPGEKLGLGVSAFKGYFSSIQPATTRILVNINVSYGAFYEGQPLIDLMKEYYGRKSYSDKSCCENLSQFLEGVRVTHSYLKDRSNESDRSGKITKVATIRGLGFDENGMPATPKVAKFRPTGGNEDITVLEHFFQAHNHVIAHGKLPVVDVGASGHPVYLPPELCTVLPGQRPKSNLERESGVSSIVEMVKREVGNDVRDIKETGIMTIGLLKGGDESVNKRLESFGVSVPKSELITVQSRVLSAPKISYHEGGNENGSGDNLVGWNLVGCKLGSEGAKSLMCVNIHMEGEERLENLPKYLEILRKDCEANGVYLELDKDSPTNILINKTRMLPGKELKVAFSKKVDCVLVILPDTGSVLYNYVKGLADVVYGVTTVCLVAQTLKNVQERANRKAAKSATKSATNIATKDAAKSNAERNVDIDTLGTLAGNLALKFNLKFNKNNQGVDEKQILQLDETMIVGIDVTHSPNKKDPSIAAMVASIDENLGLWPAVLRRQESAGVEMVSYLEEMLKTRLELWKSKSKSKSGREYPKNIIVYRDGVSEGQYGQVLKTERPQMVKAFEDLYGRVGQALPKLTIVIAAKRHHIRFYDGPSSNPEPGTLVDRGVTEALKWDFFMQPHKALKGVARPIHYFVLHDDIFRHNFENQAAQMLVDFTHRLCYIFGRCTMAVSICAPAYYADIACERARRYLSAGDLTPSTGNISRNPPGSEGLIIHPNLRDTMFYI